MSTLCADEADSHFVEDEMIVSEGDLVSSVYVISSGLVTALQSGLSVGGMEVHEHGNTSELCLDV